MGLPEVIISFSSAAASAVQRSQQGIVALILRDDTVITFTTKTYSTIADVSQTDWTAGNYDLIEKTFLGSPYQVIVVRGATADLNYTTQLDLLAIMQWDWLAVPGIATGDVAAISTWIISERSSKQTFKAVLPNSASDNEGIVNFATTGIMAAATAYTTTEYTARIAGILAGLPLTRAATYYALSEVTAITQSITPDTDINSGELILINDGQKIKIARGVNSLVTIAAPKSADWQKIKIIEGHDLITSDIVTTFSDAYVGQINNDYDNQAIFIASVNTYLNTLAGTVLDPNATNTIGVDIAAQRLAWETAGTDTTTWSDQKVKETAFQAKVFLSGTMKFLDAMEDLQFAINV